MPPPTHFITKRRRKGRNESERRLGGEIEEREKCEEKKKKKEKERRGKLLNSSLHMSFSSLHLSIHYTSFYNHYFIIILSSKTNSSSPYFDHQNTIKTPLKHLNLFCETKTLLSPLFKDTRHKLELENMHASQVKYCRRMKELGFPLID